MVPRRSKCEAGTQPEDLSSDSAQVDKKLDPVLIPEVAVHSAALPVLHYVYENTQG